jgi:hypothetical protein
MVGLLWIINRNECRDMYFKALWQFMPRGSVRMTVSQSKLEPLISQVRVRCDTDVTNYWSSWYDWVEINDFQQYGDGGQIIRSARLQVCDETVRKLRTTVPRNLKWNYKKTANCWVAVCKHEIYIFTEVASCQLCTVSSFWPQCFIISRGGFVLKVRCCVFGDFATTSCEDVHISHLMPVCAQRILITFDIWQFF